ncbi:MAG: HPr family phosphocarrier protein [Deltaproteobacteria bacterium]|nr:HPr family phosphocarrier protein [Deltaproteobacteria bacterium]
MNERHRQAVTITNTLGLHARAAANFVKMANRFRCTVSVQKGTVSVNGKSIMGVLMLAAAKGTAITIHAEGTDAQEAVHTLCHLVQQRFGEE